MYARKKASDRIGKAGANSGEMNFEKQKDCEASARVDSLRNPLELVHFIFHPEDLGLYFCST